MSLCGAGCWRPGCATARCMRGTRPRSGGCGRLTMHTQRLCGGWRLPIAGLCLRAATVLLCCAMLLRVRLRCGWLDKNAYGCMCVVAGDVILDVGGGASGRGDDAVLSFGVCDALVCCMLADGTLRVCDVRRPATALYTLACHSRGTQLFTQHTNIYTLAYVDLDEHTSMSVC